MKKFFERLVANGAWYYTLSIATAGLFAWVPFLHAASRLNDDGLRRPALLYGVAAVALASMAGVTPTDAQGEPEGAAGAFLSTVTAIAAIAVIAAACVQLRPMRRAAYRIRDDSPVIPAHVDPAVAHALAARRRRDDARELAKRDPRLVHDLRIGRPDRPRNYDDGGLVDLNSAPADVIASTCGLDNDVAERVVSGRQQWATGFSSINEVFAYVDLSERDEAALRDRGIVLPL